MKGQLREKAPVVEPPGGLLVSGLPDQSRRKHPIEMISRVLQVMLALAICLSHHSSQAQKGDALPNSYADKAGQGSESTLDPIPATGTDLGPSPAPTHLQPPEAALEPASESRAPENAAAGFANSSLRGTVLERGTGVPLEEVQVSADGERHHTLTDADGRYWLQLAPNRYTVTYSLRGYHAQQHRIRLDLRLKQQPTVFLEPLEDRSEMVVVGARTPREMNLEVISRSDLERVPGTMGDPIKALESLPNVARSGFLDGALVVRGAEPANAVVELDGHPVPFLFHFGIWKSVINPYFVESLNFYPGGMPAQYGNVLQAVVEVRSRHIPTDRTHGVADLNLADSSATLLLPARENGMALGVSVRFSYLSLLILGLTSIGEQQAALFPRYGDYQARFDKVVGEGVFSIAVVGARDSVRLGDDLVHVTNTDAQMYAAYGVDPYEPFLSAFQQLRVGFRSTLPSGVSWRTSTMVSLERQTSLLPFQEDLLRLPALTKIVRPVLGQRLEFLWPVSARLSLISGLDVRGSRAMLTDLSGIFTGWDGNTPKPSVAPVVSTGLYGRVEWQPLEALMLVPELRANLYSFNDHLAPWLEPRATVRLRLPGSALWKSGLGLFSQMPEERQYSAGGNHALRLMKALQASTGFEARLRAGLELESTLFATRMWDLTSRGMDVVVVDTDYGPVHLSTPTYYMADGWGLGGEITIKAHLNELKGSLSYAYTRSLREYNGTLGAGDYDQPHCLTMMAQLPLVMRTELSGRFRLSSGQPYTPDSGAWSPSEGEYLPVKGPINSARYAPYHQLDLRLERKLLKPRYALTYYMDLQNIYFARNPMLVQQNWNYTEVGSYIWIPLVVTLGAKGEF